MLRNQVPDFYLFIYFLGQQAGIVKKEHIKMHGF